MALTKIDDRGLKTPIDLQDNEKIRLGTGNDLEIFHNGADSKIVTSTGDLWVQTTADDLVFKAADDINFHPGTTETGLLIKHDAGVELFYDNSKKFETRSSGALVTGDLEVNAGSVHLTTDNQRLRLGGTYGGSGDLELWHSGSASYIQDNGPGDLIIRASDQLKIQDTDNGETMAIFNKDGAVSLYCDGVNTLSTTSQGAEVKIATGNTRLRVHSDTTSSPTPGIELMRGTNDTFGADAYTDWSIINSGANLVFSSAHNGSTYARTTVDYNGVLWHGVDPTTHFNNRSAYFHNGNHGDNWNYVSITGGTSGGAGIVFGDSVGNNTGNYESLIAHDNTNNSLYLKTHQTAKGLEIKVGGDVSIMDGNLVVASGHGIDFSATSDASGKQNELLDDYEEGTWTPALASTGTAFTSVTNWSSESRYTKIGRIVTVQCYHRTGGVDKGSAASTDGVVIGGLPFTPTNSTQRSTVVISNNVNWAGSPNTATVFENSTNIFLYKYASSGSNNSGTPITVADVGTAANNNYAIFTITYEVA